MQTLYSYDLTVYTGDGSDFFQGDVYALISDDTGARAACMQPSLVLPVGA